MAYEQNTTTVHGSCKYTMGHDQSTDMVVCVLVHWQLSHHHILYIALHVVAWYALFGLLNIKLISLDEYCSDFGFPAKKIDKFDT